MIKALYVHVPFCRSICSYCDFMRVGYHPKLVRDYLDALSMEVKTLDLSQIDSIYIGGGTPSALTVDELQELFSYLKPAMTHVTEATIEINPETLDPDKVRCMRDFGINRVSLGVQSFIPEELQRLSRKHSNQTVIDCIEMLRQEGIDNISLDLMYGLPLQTLDHFKFSLEKALSLPITHVSIYALTIEEHSAWGRAGVKPVSSELEEAMYQLAIDTCEAQGFNQYEISNFTKGRPSSHNTHYWLYDDYGGLGPGAVGMIDGKRIENTSNLMDYAHGTTIGNITELSIEDQCFERIMMGLRLKEGIDLSRYTEKTGLDLTIKYKDAIRKNVDHGLLVIKNNHILCTPQGYGLLHDILIDFMD